MSNVIVVDNLPVVPEAKYQKLLDFVTKIYAAVGPLAANGVNMPLNKASGQSEGFAFVEFVSKADAEAAIARTNNWDFDKAHKLAVNRYTDFAAYAREPDHFTPPSLAVPPPRDDLFYWLQDDGCRDEFAVRWAAAGPGGADVQMTEVLWADTRGPPLMDYGGDRQRAAGRYWTERGVQWSPRGGYLVTYHPQGLVLWGGRGFQECRRLAHPHVNAVVFSPDERYALTWNGRYGNHEPERAAIVWDLRTQQELRAFRQLRPTDVSPDLVWSHDSKYLARVGADPSTGAELVYVYEMPSVGLLDQRSIKAPGAQDLSWCPKRGNLLSWWSPEKDNAPTSVTVMRLPGREILRQRNLFNVEGCELRWHPEGAFLAVIAAKAKKNAKKKGDSACCWVTLGGGGRHRGARAVALPFSPVNLSHPNQFHPILASTRPVPAESIAPPERRGAHGFTLEFFRLRDKAVGVEVMETPNRVLDLFWEPGTGATGTGAGARFALVTEAPAQPSRYAIGFYEVTDKGAPHLLFSLDDRIHNAVLWSPAGNGSAVLMNTLSPSNQGALEFYDVTARKSHGTAEHAQCTDAAWDPSGRLLATWKSQPMHREPTTRETVQNGYQLWTFQGTRLFDTERPKMFQFTWRPRPDK
jgi:translation initiation factor 3 subunit B